jgi:hypothetical protein
MSSASYHASHIFARRTLAYDYIRIKRNIHLEGAQALLDAPGFLTVFSPRWYKVVAYA